MFKGLIIVKIRIKDYGVNFSSIIVGFYFTKILDWPPIRDRPLNWARMGRQAIFGDRLPTFNL